MKIFLLIIVSLITIVTYQGKPVYASTVYFSDDFEDGDISDWIPTNNSCGSTWRIQNRNGSNKLGIVINGNCFTEIAPAVWDSNVTDYKLTTDMEFVSGTDKNLAFRFTDHSSWYDIHFVTNDTSKSTEIVLQRVFNTDKYSNKVTVQNMFNGNTYHVGIEIVGEHIKIFIDNNLVLDYPDAGGRFPTGSIALQASAGGDPHSEVWFDNVLVTSIEAPAEPVVILPGFLGSFCLEAIISGGDCSGSWTALPEPLDPYDSLVASITNAADIPDDDVFVFYYDWRKRINDLSEQLNTYINSTVLSGKPAGTKVRLVGHSYGGLIAADYAQDHPDKVSKLITAGSPHKGVVKGYGAWQGGELWGFNVWQRISLRILLAARGGLFPSLKDTIRNDIPAIQQTLPTFDYLTDQNNQTISESSLSQRNPKLGDQYAGLSNIKALLTTLTGLENKPEDTLSSIKVKPRSWIEAALGLWEDGKPDQLTYSTEGDTTVLRSSGRYDDAVAKPEVGADHVDLISQPDGINAILSALGSSASAQITDTFMDENKSWTAILLRSPATLALKSGDDIFPDDDGDGLMVFDQSLSGEIEIILTGTGSGQYHVDILSFDKNGDSTQTFTGNITTGQVITIPVDLTPKDNQPDQLDDTTGEKTLDFAINAVDEMISDVSAATGRARSKQILVSSLRLIKTGLTRAKSQINKPAQSARTTQAAMLSLHRFRSGLNSYNQVGHIDNTSAAKLRNKSRDTINLLQSGFSILSDRSGKTYPSRQLNSLSTLVGRQTDIVEQRTTQSSKDKMPAAIASLAASDDQTQADSAKTSGDSGAAYINYLSARMYLQEALLSLH